MARFVSILPTFLVAGLFWGALGVGALASPQATINASGPLGSVKIGFVAGFTGTDPNTAKELWRGLNIAIENAPRLKSRITVVKFDNKGDPAITAKIVNEAIASGIKILIGFPTSDEALAAAKVAAGRDVVVISPFATNPAISQQGDNIIQLSFSDAFQGKILARFTANDLKPARVLTLTNIESVYSVGLGQAFRDALAQYAGAAHIAEHTYTKQDLKLAELADLIRTLHPDVIFVPDHIIRASVLIKKAHEVDPHIRFVGGDGLGGQDVFLKVFGDTKDIELYYSSTWHRRLPSDENHLFLKRYTQAFTTSEPTSGAALSWDAARILLRALDEKQDLNDTAALLRWIEKTKFAVTTGELELNKPRSAPSKSAVLISLRKGQYGYLRQIK